MEQFNCNVDIEEVENVGNYGKIICKNVVKSFIDDDGDIQSYSTYVYNVRLKDGSLISDEWFDIYEYDHYGNCIIGFSRSNLECLQLRNIPLYYSGAILHRQYTYRYGAINSNGVLSVKPIYDRLTFNNENSFTGYHNGRLGYIDSIDGHHITPIVFTHAQPFFENKAAVEFNGSMGYVDRKKTMRNPNNEADYAISPKYDTADDFENGYAEVSINEKLYIIDSKGDICLSNNFVEDKATKESNLKKLQKK